MTVNIDQVVQGFGETLVAQSPVKPEEISPQQIIIATAIHLIIDPRYLRDLEVEAWVHDTPQLRRERMALRLACSRVNVVDPKQPLPGTAAELLEAIQQKVISP